MTRTKGHAKGVQYRQDYEHNFPPLSGSMPRPAADAPVGVCGKQLGMDWNNVWDLKQVLSSHMSVAYGCRGGPWV